MEKLVEIIAEVLKPNHVHPGSITDETRLRDDLGFDSFRLAELTVHVEEEFGVDIFEDGLIETVGEIRAKLRL